MKALPFLILLFLLAIALDRLHAEPPRVRLDAKTSSASRETEDRWKTTYGSFDKAKSQLRNVSVSLECTKGTGKATLIVQWIGRNTAKNSAAELIATESQPIDLKPGLTHRTEFTRLFSETDTKYAALGTRDRSGHRYGGWIIRILDATTGTVLSEQSSSQPYLKKFPAPETPALVPVPVPAN